ncbi:hypothetical protein BCR33DRAFT_737186 [Rhizoclosmatium globosum]|uniref:CCHC-type domain-containing protein n=1 Tax=Rhizoclosmatium globosum TaxID=329046 RepID=A0A1Y2CGQ6_9FUNG|nr:hypothetical protein BCR33DRAFT_737186 [Rhizoclosmatium globosum]|eukprot:ORY46106.1 hypothetical protein BCR33DRAFT_737186 [Rhizoclosmatium globosum]
MSKRTTRANSGSSSLARTTIKLYDRTILVLNNKFATPNEEELQPQTIAVLADALRLNFPDQFKDFIEDQNQEPTVREVVNEALRLSLKFEDGQVLTVKGFNTFDEACPSYWSFSKQQRRHTPPLSATSASSNASVPEDETDSITVPHSAYHTPVGKGVRFSTLPTVTSAPPRVPTTTTIVPPATNIATNQPANPVTSTVQQTQATHIPVPAQLATHVAALQQTVTAPTPQVANPAPQPPVVAYQAIGTARPLNEKDVIASITTDLPYLESKTAARWWNDVAEARDTNVGTGLPFISDVAFLNALGRGNIEGDQSAKQFKKDLQRAVSWKDAHARLTYWFLDNKKLREMGAEIDDFKWDSSDPDLEAVNIKSMNKALPSEHQRTLLELKRGFLKNAPSCQAKDDLYDGTEVKVPNRQTITNFEDPVVSLEDIAKALKTSKLIAKQKRDQIREQRDQRERDFNRDNRRSDSRDRRPTTNYSTDEEDLERLYTMLQQHGIDRKQLSCYKCGRNGHFAKECPSASDIDHYFKNQKKFKEWLEMTQEKQLSSISSLSLDEVTDMTTYFNSQIKDVSGETVSPPQNIDLNQLIQLIDNRLVKHAFDITKPNQAAETINPIKNDSTFTSSALENKKDSTPFTFNININQNELNNKTTTAHQQPTDKPDLSNSVPKSAIKTGTKPKPRRRLTVLNRVTKLEYNADVQKIHKNRAVQLPTSDVERSISNRLTSDTRMPKPSERMYTVARISGWVHGVFINRLMQDTGSNHSVTN